MIFASYKYDSQGRLLKVITPNKTVEYKHNALGNRVAKLVDGEVTEKYLWQNKTTLLAIYDKDDNLKQRFEYTLGHVPTSFTQNNQRYYILTDQIGSPKLIADENGNTVKQLDYDSFGNLITDSNPDFAIPFGFAGGLQDNDTGLIRFGYRDYDPETGRWTARDPIGFAGGDTNLYGYVLGDPVNMIDPTGQIGIVGGLVGGAIGGVASGISAALSGGNVWTAAASGALTGAVFGFTGGIGSGALTVGRAAINGAASGATGSALNATLDGKSAVDVAQSAAIGGLLGVLSGGFGNTTALANALSAFKNGLSKEASLARGDLAGQLASTLAGIGLSNSEIVKKLMNT